ncbi:MAG: CZB domain-containing protein, partial [Rhodospirillaceae bacterium]
AVVASEVRKLAERSRLASTEISALSIQTLITSEEAEQMLAKLVPDIQRTANLVAEISSAAREQNAGVEQINTAIQQLDQVTQSNSASSEEMSSTSEELSASAEAMSASASAMSESADDLNNSAAEMSAVSEDLRSQAENLQTAISFFILSGSTRDSMIRHLSLIERTKADHTAFRKKIIDTVAGQGDANPDKLADHHTCRLGKWYDNIQLPAIRMNHNFINLERPHASVHESGKRALRCHIAGDSGGAHDALFELEQASEHVLELLEGLAQDVRASRRSPAGRLPQQAPVATKQAAPVSAPVPVPQRALPTRPARAPAPAPSPVRQTAAPTKSQHTAEHRPQPTLRKGHALKLSDHQARNAREDDDSGFERY